MQIAPPLFEVEVPRSGGGENVEKSKDERSKLKVTARQRSIDFSPYGRRPSVHIQLLATLIENLFLMFSLRYGQDDKYRENSSSTLGGEVSLSAGGEEHGNVTTSNSLFIKNRPPYFFIITDFTIFIKNIPYYIIILTINICYEKNYVIDVVCCGNAVGQL